MVPTLRPGSNEASGHTELVFKVRIKSVRQIVWVTANIRAAHTLNASNVTRSLCQLVVHVRSCFETAKLHALKPRMEMYNPPPRIRVVGNAAHGGVTRSQEREQDDALNGRVRSPFLLNAQRSPWI